MFKSALTLGSFAWLLMVAVPALAADASHEIVTAAAHAGMAAGAEAPQMVKAHLQHVLNCLEGPHGADFNVAPGNPCQGQGAGAIPDSTPDKRKGVEAAAEQAKKALAEANIDKAKAMASAIQNDLSK
jgi:hypothetical protein